MRSSHSMNYFPLNSQTMTKKNSIFFIVYANILWFMITRVLLRALLDRPLPFLLGEGVLLLAPFLGLGERLLLRLAFSSFSFSSCFNFSLLSRSFSFSFSRSLSFSFSRAYRSCSLFFSCSLSFSLRSFSFSFSLSRSLSRSFSRSLSFYSLLFAFCFYFSFSLSSFFSSPLADVEGFRAFKLKWNEYCRCCLFFLLNFSGLSLGFLSQFLVELVLDSLKVFSTHKMYLYPFSSATIFSTLICFPSIMALFIYW